MSDQGQGKAEKQTGKIPFILIRDSWLVTRPSSVATREKWFVTRGWLDVLAHCRGRWLVFLHLFAAVK
jgi:hypothetical protein